MHPPTPSGLARATVLVVEDEILIRKLTAEAFTDAGFCTLEAGDAQSAIRQLEAHPDVAFVVSDINMPGELSGIDLCRVVHARFRQVKLALTSGKPPADRSGIPAGTVFLQKPYSPEALVEHVRAELVAELLRH